MRAGLYWILPILSLCGHLDAPAQVKLSRHAVQQALSSQQQQQVQGAGALGVIKDAGATATTPDGGATSNSAASGAAEAAHGINLMKHPVMVELEYPDVALAADGW